MANPQDGSSYPDGYLPTEFSYEIPPAPEAVVAFRQEQYILGNVTSYANNPTCGQSNELVFTLTGDQMVDLSSIKLIVDAKVNFLPTYRYWFTTGPAVNHWNRWDSVTSATPASPSDDVRIKANENIHMASSMSWFKTLEISTRTGEKIETIQDACTLGRIVECMSFARSHCDRDGSFHNSEWDPVERNAKWALKSTLVAGTTLDHSKTVTNEATCTIEISALRLLGFLNTGKFIKASQFGGQPGSGGGGLTFTFTMAEDYKIFTLRKESNATGLTYTNGRVPQLSFSNARLVYDTCIMSDAYQQWFRSTYENRGMRIVFDSYQGYTEVPLTSYTGAVSVNLQVQAKRAKALLWVMRWQQNRNLNIANHLSFESELFRKHVKGASYQLTANGVRYPNVPIDSAAKAHAQLLTVCYARSDVHRDCVNIHEFTNNFSRAVHPNFTHPYTDPTYGRLPDRVEPRTCGGFVGCIDFEKYNTNGESGIAISPSTTSLSLTFPTTVASTATEMEGYAFASDADKAVFCVPYRRADFTGVAEATNPPDMPIITCFLIRSQAITVANGRVLLDY